MTTSTTSTVVNSLLTNGNNNTNNNNNSNNNIRIGSARERAMQAVDYYNNSVLRARVGAGLAGTRSSVNERHLHSRSMNITNNRLYQQNPDNLYRSNSSLELLHEHSSNHNEIVNNAGNGLRREYGSHGSIDVISSADRTPTTGESFFAMLQDYRPAVLSVIGTDQRSPGPAEYLKGKIMDHGQQQLQQQNMHNHQTQQYADDMVDRGNASPKLKMKLHRLWGPVKPCRTQNHVASLDDSSVINTSASSKQIVTNGCSISVTSNSSSVSTISNNSSSTQSSTTTLIASSSADIEERQRRRAFAHYDCQSLTANLGYAAKLRGLLLARRRNTTTGASAASMLSTRSSTPDAAIDSGDEDYGDGQNNDLIESCPYFRNEVGGEEEREVSLTRMQSSLPPGQQRRAIHRPALAYGVSVLECSPGETLWKPTTCPLQKGLRPIESVDQGAKYYRQYFLGQEHQNWFGMDDQLGPVAISIKREKLPPSNISQSNGQPNESNSSNQQTHYQFRMIVRTSELLTLRGSVIEDSIPNPRGSGKPVSTKEVLEYVAPEVQMNCLRLGVNTPQCEQQLLKLDEQGLTNKYKIGVLYCRAGQHSEEDMYNNEDAGPAFTEFLGTLGKTVRLKGFEHYKAGLDNKTDSTGTESVYATYQDCEIMFHVSTMLPFTPNNRQQLLRKRHIGNDIVTIVFQEPGALPFSPKNIRSQFQHVFIIVRAVNPCTENTSYRIAVSRSKEVPIFGPPIRAGAVYPKIKSFTEMLLAKIVNAENAAHRSEKFTTMATRTRQEYLKDLTANYCTTNVVDTGPKFSIFPSKKKERPKPRFSGDLSQRGAFCWQVVLHDSGQSQPVDCFLGISADTFVLIEECSRQIVFVTPCKSILGWSTNGNSLRIYHHHGECVTLNMRDTGERDEQLEVIERLRAVTLGCGALELNLRRNTMGQLGFHVQPDGLVTQVEMSGQAWTAGLRQGYRLVEICKVAVATLSHDQMVDLLKTSAQVTVTVIESFSDHSPRRGCHLTQCKFNMINYEGDYENLLSSNNETKNKKNAVAQLQQPVANHRRKYERNFSPPRSSNSSGYGTGSSSRSFNAMNNEPVRYATDMGTLTSSSSSHSSNDDRWYDIMEVNENGHDQQPASQQNGISVAHHQQLQQQHQQPQYVSNNHSNNNTNYHQKVTGASNSLPLSGTRPLSIHEPGDKVTNGMNKIMTINESRPLPRTANIEYLVTKVPKMQDYVSADMLVKNLSINENTTDNEPVYSTINKPHPNQQQQHMLQQQYPQHQYQQTASGAMTDDEELIINNNCRNMNDMSPQLKRSSTANSLHSIYGSKNKPNGLNNTGNNGGSTTVSSSASSSRNNSPRPHTEAKLRTNVTNRNINSQQQRNSVNYTTSTLQEDLIKLINPDYNITSNDDNFNHGNLTNINKTQKSKQNSHSLGNISNLASLKPALLTDDLLLMKKKSRSREGINLGSSTHHHNILGNLKMTQNATSNGNSNTKVINDDEKIISNNNNNNNNNNGNGNVNANSNGNDDHVIFTTARPATVISSSTGSSPAPSEIINNCNNLNNKLLHIKEDNAKLSPRKLSNNVKRKCNDNLQLPLLPDSKEVDWNSLVETATRAMMQVKDDIPRSSVQDFYEELNENNLRLISNSTPSPPTIAPLANLSEVTTPNSLSPTISNCENDKITIINHITNSTSLPEIQNHLIQLEERVVRETRRRKSLEHTVKRLTEENRRLQDESQAAVQQLRRFTEWFFQTIDRQA